MQLGMKTFKQDEEVQTFSIKYCPSEATEDTWMFPGKEIKSQSLQEREYCISDTGHKIEENTERRYKKDKQFMCDL